MKRPRSQPVLPSSAGSCYRSTTFIPSTQTVFKNLQHRYTCNYRSGLPKSEFSGRKQIKKNDAFPTKHEYGHVSNAGILPQIQRTSSSSPRMNVVHMVKRQVSKVLERMAEKRFIKEVEKRREKASWAQLIEEFEGRANAKFNGRKNKNNNNNNNNAQSSSSIPDTLMTLRNHDRLPRQSPRHKYLNSEQFKWLPDVECTYMACITCILWYLGRILRLDAFLLLFYPLPTLYISARWGLSYADRTFAIILFLACIRMGPLYAKLYFFNSGLLTLAYTRAIWYQWPWYIGLFAGSIAKAIGVAISVVWFSVVLRVNSWKLLTHQVEGIIKKIGTLLVNNLPFLFKTVPNPSFIQIQIGIGVVIGLYSLYHVFCTLFVTTLILIKVSERAELARVPKDMPFIVKLLRRMEGNLE